MISDFISDFGGKKVLITGGLGFIGSNLGRRLQQFGAEVFLLVSPVPEYGSNLYNISGFEDWVRVNVSDVRDVHNMRHLIHPSIRIVFASTRQIYGKPDHLPVNEGRLLRPVDVNRINKMPGWERKISLREGPQRTIEFYRMNLRHYP